MGAGQKQGADAQDDGYDAYGAKKGKGGTLSDDGDEGCLADTGVGVTVAKVVYQEQAVGYKSLCYGQKPYRGGNVEDGCVGALEEEGVGDGYDSEEEKHEDVSHGNAREQGGVEEAEHHACHADEYALPSAPCYEWKSAQTRQ